MVTNTSVLEQQADMLRPQSAGHQWHGHGPGHLALTLVHILLALWAWLANVTQVVNLVLDAKLRRQPVSVLIISISVSELLVAGFLCPLYTDSLLRGPWQHGLLLCSMYEVVLYLQACVSSLAVLVLNVERFYFLVAPRLLQAPSRRHVTAMLTSLPWLVGLVVIVPLFTQGARAVSVHEAGLRHQTCVVEWDRTMHIIIIFVSFLAPAFLLLATVVAVLLVYVISRVHDDVNSGEAASPPSPAEPRWLHSVSENAAVGDTRRSGRSARRRRHFSGLQEVDAKTKRECVAAVCASSCLCVGLQSPFFTLLLLQQLCQHPAQPASSDSHGNGVLLQSAPAFGESGDCQFSDTAWMTSMMLIMLKPGLMPLVWLVYSNVRAGFSPKACPFLRRCFSWRTAPSSVGAGRRDDSSENPESVCTSACSLVSQATTI